MTFRINWLEILIYDFVEIFVYFHLTLVGFHYKPANLISSIYLQIIMHLVTIASNVGGGGELLFIFSFYTYLKL